MTATAESAPIEGLLQEVSRRAGWIESPSECAAHLESMGITDDDARYYGYEDVFDLAHEVASSQRSEHVGVTSAWATERRLQADAYEEHRPPSVVTSILRFFMRGLVFGMPMAIMIFAILLLLFSLWAYYYFSTARATAIGLGTALSYFLAGGFTQAIGRRGLMYVKQDMHKLSLKLCAVFVAAGIVMTICVAVFLYFFTTFFGVIASSERVVLITYYVTLSVLWLGLATLYMLQQEILFSVAIAVGIAVVYFVYVILGANIVLAHSIGILSAALFSLIASTIILLFRHYRTRDTRIPLLAKLPRPSLLLASIAPFFLFGVLYFLLIFTDRLMAWTGNMPFRETFVWFRADYEVGENWALLGLIPALGVLEYTLYRFSHQVRARQFEYTLAEVGGFRAWFMRFYIRQMIVFLVAAILGAVIAYFGVHALLPRLPTIAILFSPISVFVFIFAVIGYLFAAFGLLNTSMFFWLSRPRLALVAIVPGVVVDVVVAFLLSRGIQFYWAVIGFTVGSIVFAVLSTVIGVRILTELDYYYYSAV